MPCFNVRVYGILINDQNQVLVSDEFIRGSYYTKFPGGGLEFGEGTRDCLKREFREEMDLRVEIGDHIYTTDFFQLSAFKPEDQIISVYYFVKPLEEIKVPLPDKVPDSDDRQMDFDRLNRETETFRFINWENFSSGILSLPIDKVVADMIKAAGVPDHR